MSKNNNISLEELTKGDEACYHVKDVTIDPEMDGKTILCDLFIKTLNMPELTDWKEKETPFISELYLVPRPEFITKEKIQSIIDFGGFDEEFLKEGAKFFQLEVINYGLGIRLAGGMDSYSTEKEAIEAMKNKVNGCSLIGFYLDNAWNKIGTTGWDSLKELVSNVSAITATINRMGNQS